MDSPEKGSIDVTFPVREKNQTTKGSNPAERARILRKIDLHLLPFVTVFYLLAFL